MDELDKRQLGLAAAEARLNAQQLPRVDVADGDKLGQTPRPLGVAQPGQRRGNYQLAPFSMDLAAALGYPAESGNPILFRQHLENPIAKHFVVIDQHMHRPGHISDRCLQTLAANLVRLPLHSSLEQALAASEPADHRLDCHTGAAADLIQGDLVGRHLPEDLGYGIEDALLGGCRGLGASHHRVRAGLLHFDVRQLNMNLEEMRRCAQSPTLPALTSATQPMKPLLTALIALVVACSTSAPPSASSDALPRGAIVQKLVAGRVDSLPTGTVYVRFVRFAQPPGYVINSKQHVPSIVYVETGVHRLVLADQTPIDLAAGQATFHQSVTHQHLNPGSQPAVWYSIAVWPSSARGTPLVDPIARAAFESQDFDRVALPQAAYSEVLRRVTLSTKGTSGAHRFGGIVAFYVLAGSITIRAGHRPTQTLSAGQGVAFPPDTDVQETNAGSDQADYLEFVGTQVGKDFEVPLQQQPAA